MAALGVWDRPSQDSGSSSRDAATGGGGAGSSSSALAAPAAPAARGPLKRKRISALDDEDEGFDPSSVVGVGEDDSEDDVNPRDLEPEYFKKRTRHIPELPRKDFPLQVGHADRPLWILPADPRRRDKTVGGRIILETFSPYYQTSYEFMVAIAEPVSRPTHVHEWQITIDSLYSAVACGIPVDEIIKTLRILSKTALHEDVEAFVRNSVKLVGKVRRVLVEGRYFVESSDRKLLTELRYKFAHMPTQAGKVSQAVVNWEKIDRLLRARDKLRGGVNGGNIEWELDFKEDARQEAKRLILDKPIDEFRTEGIRQEAKDLIQARNVAAQKAYEDCTRAAPRAMSTANAEERYDPKEVEFARAAEDLTELGICSDGFYEARRQALEESQRDKTLEGVMDLQEQLNHDEESEKERQLLAQREKEASKMSGGGGRGSGRNAKLYQFEIELGRIKDCTQCAKEAGIPMLEEYEYLKDSMTPTLNFNLKGHAKIRDYQSLALNKMFSHSRSRSGVIVLPCGSGKTIVGITAAVTIKKSCLCLVTGGVSVEQWKAQFEYFTNIDPRLVCRFTAAAKDELPPDGKVSVPRPFLSPLHPSPPPPSSSSSFFSSEFVCVTCVPLSCVFKCVMCPMRRISIFRIAWKRAAADTTETLQSFRGPSRHEDTVAMCVCVRVCSPA
jgi:DNA excision repair protein ERCC-3